MADSVKRVEYYHVSVPDQPGSSLKVMSALKDAGVNLLAYLGFPAGGGQSQIDLFPEKPADFLQATRKAGLKVSGKKQAFLVQGSDRAGAVADITRKLADARVNITASAAASAGAGRYGMIVWVAPADYERAAKALGV